MRTRPRLVAASFIAATLLTATACGSDADTDAEPDTAADADSDTESDTAAEDGGPGGGDFCAELTALEEADENDDLESEFVQSDVDQIRNLARSAPEDIADDIRVFADGLQGVVDLGDTDDIDAVFEILFSEELIAAGTAIETFGVEQCGFEPADPDDDTVEFSEIDDTIGEE